MLRFPNFPTIDSLDAVCSYSPEGSSINVLDSNIEEVKLEVEENGHLSIALSVKTQLAH